MITPIVSEREWRSRLDALPCWQPPLEPALIVAPHPDDEVLATGGLIAWLRDHGVDVTIAAVTDGRALDGDGLVEAVVRELRDGKPFALLRAVS